SFELVSRLFFGLPNLASGFRGRSYCQWRCQTWGIKMNLLNLLILALGCLIGVVIIKRALERTRNDRDTNDEPRNGKKYENNAREARPKVILGCSRRR